MSDAVTIETPSRLHFGLIHTPSKEDADAARRYGSVGLMVRDPGLRICVRPAKEWSAEGPLSERALDYAQRYVQTIGHRDRCFQLTIERAPREHVGLGTGTQLALAVARALQVALEMPEASITQLAQQLGRGCRSGLGIHGFLHGGFLIDGGKKKASEIAPLICRWDFPDEWRILLIVPREGQGTHGSAEQRAFAVMQPATERETEKLCRLVMLEMLPALCEADLPAFGEALYEFNRRVGERFRPIQNGIYASPKMEEVVAFLRDNGVTGVGQSSWGPTVFAAVEHERMMDFADRLRARFCLDANEIIATSAANNGAVIKTSSIS